MDFFEVPIIPAVNVYRTARVSVGKGSMVTEELAGKGLVQSIRTPTGRTLLSPKDAKAVFEALVAA